MVRKTILGDSVQVPTNNEVAVIMLSMRKDGTCGIKCHYLTVKFLIGIVSIENEILIARSTDGFGDTRPINERLFGKLHNEGFDEEIKSHLSDFLMDEYDKGEIKKEDIVRRMEEFFGIREV